MVTSPVAPSSPAVAVLEECQQQWAISLTGWDTGGECGAVYGVECDAYGNMMMMCVRRGGGGEGGEAWTPCVHLPVCTSLLLVPFVSTLPCPTSLPPTYPLPHSSRPPLPPRPTPQASDILSAGKSSSLGDSRMAAPEDIVTRLAKLAISCTAMPTASRPSMLRVA
ncbi:unnamed protein product [Closterium sp. NIES-65]|nr:unnamed protein product [Closterium sp. NIES-65]